MSSCTREHLSKTLSQYYTNEELIESKNLLHSVFKVLGPPPNRPSSPVRPERQAHSDDIVEALFKLDSEHNVEFEFGVQNGTRMPKWDPNIYDMMSLAEKLTAVEARLNNVEYVVSENKAAILQSNENIEKLDRKTESLSLAVTNHDTVSQNTYATIVKDTESLRTRRFIKNKNIMRQENAEPSKAPTLDPVSHLGAPGMGLTVSLPPSGSGWDLATGTPKLDPKLDPSQGSVQQPLSGIQNEKFVFPTHASKQIRRKERKIVQGTGRIGVLKGGPPPKRDFFVYRADQSVTSESIKQHLASHNILVCDTELISHDESKFKSFKVRVNVTDVDKIMDPTIWPLGIRVRKFFQKKTS